MTTRKGESPRTWFRSDRVFRAGGEWFFHTREGVALGPYEKRSEANADAERLTAILAEASAQEARDIVMAFVLGDVRDVDGRDAALAQTLFECEVAWLLADESDRSVTGRL